MTPIRLQIVPSLASFGPLLIVIGLCRSFNYSDPSGLLMFLVSMSGALTTSIAFAILIREIVSLREQLDAQTKQNSAS